MRWSEQQEPTFASSRGNILRRKHRSKGTKDAGIKCGQCSLPHLRFLDLEIESDPTSALQSFLGDGGLPSHIQLFDKLKWGVPIMNTNASYMLISRD